jgi:hypothetical protein
MLTFRNIVLFDAATCAVMGLALVVGAAPLSSFTLIPSAVLSYAGMALLRIAAFMAAVALGRVRSIIGPALVVGGNVLWVVASVALLVDDWITPNGFGYVFIGAQAAAVAVLAAIELAALRRRPVGAMA